MDKSILKYSAILLIMIGGFGADYHSKKWAEDNLRNKPAAVLSTHFLDLGYAENRGMVFGVLNGRMSEFSSGIMTFIRASIFLGLSVFIWIKRKQPYWFLLPFLLFWAGAAGNLIDSIARGYVVDFIHIHAGSFLNWPFYFNLADAYITLGMVLVAVYELIRMFHRKPSFLA